MNITITHTGSSSLVGQTQPFSHQRIRFGRRPDNDIIFDPHQDRSVSGYHAEILINGDTAIFKDLETNNGTWINGTRISAPVTLSNGDMVRFGEQGPEMRINLEAATMPASERETLPFPTAEKVGIGKATLERSIQNATQTERSKNRTATIALVLVIAIVAGAGAFLMNNENKKAEEDRKRLELQTQAATAKVEQVSQEMAGIRSATEKALTDSMSRYEKELNDLKGKIGAGESRVARLIVEIQERDNALDNIKKRQDLSEEQRKKLLKETESKLAGLKNDLAASEKKLRASVSSAPSWATTAEKYKESLFLCYVESKPDEQGRISSGTGTAFCVRKDGLLATNAHVAAMFLNDDFAVKIVIQNDTGKIFMVKKAKNHPEYKTPASPDVALVLIDTQGIELPAMPLATTEDLKKLRIGTQLGTMGYPGELSRNYLSGYDQKTQTAKTALATFKDGWIGRITNFKGARADFSSSYFIQHSASLSGGTSGSPMFNADGKVVGLNNSGMDLFVTVKQGETSGTQRTPSAAEIGNAIRVDLLQDLIKQTNW